MTSIDNPFHKKRKSPADFPPSFMEVWNFFKVIDQESPKDIGVDLHGLVFDKIYSSRANCWLIFCHAKRLTDTTIVLAHVKIDTNVFSYRTSTEESWHSLRTPDEFVNKLFDLIEDPANKRLFFIMQQENDKAFFMGFFHADEPYEIDYRSVKFCVSAEQCDLLLAQKEPKKSFDTISATIIKNIYPQTSTCISNDVSKYKFITFNGFLFKPIEIVSGENVSFTFKAQFIRDMKM